MSVWIGIDPGLDGALAVMAGGAVEVFPTPVAVTKGSKREYLVSSMRQLLDGVRPLFDGEVLAMVEVVAGSMAGNFSTGYKQGRGNGLWEGLLAGMCIPYELVSPVRWKGAMGLHGQEKSGSVVLVQRMFPDLAGAVTGPRGRALDGPADAVLLAEYARRRATGSKLK